MEQITYAKLSINHGKPRVWIEGVKLKMAGFIKGSRYRIEESGYGLQLVLDPDGKRIVSGRVRNGKDIPIIDLNSEKVGEVLEGCPRVRVVFVSGTISITSHHEDVKQEERETRIKNNLKACSVTEASLCTGGGVSTLALHQAAGESGIGSSVAWVVDVELKYLQVAASNNYAIDDDTAFIVGAIEEVEPEFFTPVDVLSVSLPCSGYSKAGKSKHGKTPESHEGATSVFGLVNAIKYANPAVIISENVTEAFESPIYQLLTAELERTGYKVFHKIIKADDTPTFERRNRYWMVAMSAGIADDFEFNLPDHAGGSVQLSDLLESNIPESMWADNQYLKDKAITDKAAGKGFVRQLLTGTETFCGTIGRHYAKRRSTEPFLVRADGKERLFTPVEHARVKEIPEILVRGVPMTTAHQILGQSIDFLHGLFVGKAVFSHLGKL